MRYFSAQYVFTCDGPPLKRSIISTDDDGTIVKVEDTGGELSERHSVEFYNGIIVPGFINCHCHIEFSHLKDEIPEGTGLAGFLEGVTSNRSNNSKDKLKIMAEADRCMTAEGIVACADICNSSISFSMKNKSRIKYINLLEVFGIDGLKASKRIGEIRKVSLEAEELSIPSYVVPHSVYSVSKALFLLIRKIAETNKISSIHFLESDDEERFLSQGSGPLAEAYDKILAPGSVKDPVYDHVSAVLDNITLSGSLLLVHNTSITKQHINSLKARKNLWYCLCPNSNLYISRKLPPLRMMTEMGCDIVLGTDSLSSNSKLSILAEMITLQQNFPDIGLENIVAWATINGAKALGEDGWAGSIAPGKRPGLVLISDCDLTSQKLLPASNARRLI